MSSPAPRADTTRVASHCRAGSGSMDHHHRRLDLVHHHLASSQRSSASESDDAGDRTMLLFDSSDGHLKVVRSAAGQQQSPAETLWQHPAENCHDFHLLPSGNILCLVSWTKIIEVTRANAIVWEYDAASANGNDAPGMKVEVHGIQRLSNGRTMITEGGRKRIIEVDAAGVIRKEIQLVCDSGPHGDTRNARKLPGGSYLVAHEAEHTVREYSDAGEVIWEYEVAVEPNPVAPAGQSEYHGPAGHGPESNGANIYCAVRLRNGNTLIGTGNGHRVIEVRKRSFCAIYIQKCCFYQDRLGTNIGKTLKRGRFLLAGVAGERDRVDDRPVRAPRHSA
jgi:hypothetical protein